MATQNFEEWLDVADIENPEEVDQLYNAVLTTTDCGLFTIQPAKGTNNGWIVSECALDDSLHIVSESARQALLLEIERRYCNGENEPIWYSVISANAKKD